MSPSRISLRVHVPPCFRLAALSLVALPVISVSSAQPSALGGGPSPTPSWTAEINQPQAAFGVSVAPAGDVNGDHISDVLIGAPTFDRGQTDEGGARLYLGSSAGLATNAVWAAESNQDSASFGLCVAPAGDVNGDGYADALVG